jgi:hypothetical protein
MSVKYIIAHEDHEVMNWHYFVEQLKKKWSEVRVHFISGPNVPLLQFETPDDFWVLGDFAGSGISYTTTGLSTIAQFALWYRSIVPTQWKLQYYDSGLYFDPMSLTTETTEEQIIAGFDIPFDVTRYQ